MKTQAILNGFGRFGLHLLNYYLDRYQDCSFKLNSINDEILSVNQMISIIQKDRYVRILENWDMSFDSNSIVFQRESNSIELEIWNLPLERYISNKSGILLECSGKYTNVLYLPETEHLQRVYISATSLSADKTLIVGLNETDYLSSDKFISYGSCTVNAYIPAANTLHNLFKVLESDVNVIHNVPEYKLNEIPNIFERRDCTLSFMGPKILNFITPENFNVNYTLLPITGVSRMDFRFKLEKPFDMNSVMNCIEGIKSKLGENLYKIHETDPGQHASLLSSFSAEFVLEQCRKVGQNLYLSAYFDTENSVNRYYDLIETIEKERRNQ